MASSIRHLEFAGQGRREGLRRPRGPATPARACEGLRGPARASGCNDRREGREGWTAAARAARAARGGREGREGAARTRREVHATATTAPATATARRSSGEPPPRGPATAARAARGVAVLGWGFRTNLGPGSDPESGTDPAEARRSSRCARRSSRCATTWVDLAGLRSPKKASPGPGWAEEPQKSLPRTWLG